MENLDKLVVMNDLMDDENVILGYALPSGKMDIFLKAVDEAARAVGAVPIELMEFDEFDGVSESAINRYWLDNRESMLSAAENILRSQGTEPNE